MSLDWKSLPLDTLTAALRDLNEENKDFEIPEPENLIAALETYDAKARTIALKYAVQARQAKDEAAASHSADAEPSKPGSTTSEMWEDPSAASAFFEAMKQFNLMNVLDQESYRRHMANQPQMPPTAPPQQQEPPPSQQKAGTAPQNTPSAPQLPQNPHIVIPATTTTPVASLPTTAPILSTKVVELTPFYPKDINTWFTQIELILSGQPDDVRCRSLVKALPTDVVGNITIHTDHTFAQIKDKLIDYYAQSDQNRLQMLLQAHELGDRKPSVALRQMQHQTPPGHDILIRMRFLQMLPDYIRLPLMVLKNASLLELGEAADKILEGYQLRPAGQPACNAIATGQLTAVDNNQLATQILNLSNEVAAIRTDRQPRYRYQYRHSDDRPQRYPRRYGSHSRDRRPNQDNPPDAPFCYYHLRFGRYARRCEPNCKWNAQQQSGNGTALSPERPPTGQQ